LTIQRQTGFTETGLTETEINFLTNYYMFAQGFPLINEDLVAVEERHNLQLAIPDYLTADFRQTLDEEIRKCAASLHSLNVEESKDMYIHLVNYCRQSGNFCKQSRQFVVNLLDIMVHAHAVCLLASFFSHLGCVRFDETCLLRFTLIVSLLKHMVVI
jgi:hypothetical protein